MPVRVGVLVSGSGTNLQALLDAESSGALAGSVRVVISNKPGVMALYGALRLPVVPVARASGIWLTDFDGKRYIDAISSWWVNIWGHANPHTAA